MDSILAIFVFEYRCIIHYLYQSVCNPRAASSSVSMIIYIRSQVSVSLDMELNTIDHIVVTGFASDLVTLLSTVASVMWNVIVLHKY